MSLASFINDGSVTMVPEFAVLPASTVGLVDMSFNPFRSTSRCAAIDEGKQAHHRLDDELPSQQAAVLGTERPHQCRVRGRDQVHVAQLRPAQLRAQPPRQTARHLRAPSTFCFLLPTPDQSYASACSTLFPTPHVCAVDQHVRTCEWCPAGRKSLAHLSASRSDVLVMGADTH